MSNSLASHNLQTCLRFTAKPKNFEPNTNFANWPFLTPTINLFHEEIIMRNSSIIVSRIQQSNTKFRRHSLRSGSSHFNFLKEFDLLHRTYIMRWCILMRLIEFSSLDLFSTLTLTTFMKIFAGCSAIIKKSHAKVQWFMSNVVFRPYKKQEAD